MFTVTYLATVQPEQQRPSGRLSLASHHIGWRSIPEQSIWDWWWTT